jgi:hypothetical protein
MSEELPGTYTNDSHRLDAVVKALWLVFRVLLRHGKFSETMACWE